MLDVERDTCTSGRLGDHLAIVPEFSGWMGRAQAVLAPTSNRTRLRCCQQGQRASPLLEAQSMPASIAELEIEGGVKSLKCPATGITVIPVT